MNETLDKELQELFKDRPEALQFLHLYSAYGALIDDLVDEEKNKDRVKLTSFLAGEVFNCNYWLKNRNQLYLLDRLIHNAYFDSVTWEDSPETWKRQHAKVYSHSAMWMTLAIIFIEFGEQTMCNFSLRLKEYAYERHKQDKI